MLQCAAVRSRCLENQAESQSRVQNRLASHLLEPLASLQDIPLLLFPSVGVVVTIRLIWFNEMNFRALIDLHGKEMT